MNETISKIEDLHKSKVAMLDRVRDSRVDADLALEKLRDALVELHSIDNELMMLTESIKHDAMMEAA